jgi:hypothetical protein
MKSDRQIGEGAVKREARVDTRHSGVAVSGHLPSSAATFTRPQGRNPRFTEMRVTS